MNKNLYYVMNYFRTNNLYKLFFSASIVSFAYISASAQVSPLYSKHFEYEQFINPAITGRDKSPFLNISHQQYWLGTQNSPNTTCIGASMRLGTFNFYDPNMMVNKSGFLSAGRMGFGGLLIQSNDGPLSSYCFTGTYAYFLPLDKASNRELSFGLSAQLLYFSVNKNILNPLDNNDPELAKLNNNSLIPESGAGIYYHDDQFFVGSSVNDLILSKTSYDSNIAPNKRDYFFQTGYKFYLKYFELEPSLYSAKIDTKPIYIYSQMKLYWKYNWVVIGYKSTQSLLAAVGFNIRRFYIGYVYEQGVSDLGSYFGPSHELMLGLNIGLFEPQGLRKRVSGGL